MKPLMTVFAIALGLTSVTAAEGDYTEHFDTLYNSLTLERKGTIVEMRARARGTEALESAVDLADPLRLVVPYTQVLYSGLLFQPTPQRTLMVGLGGAGFHRVFAEVFPESLLQTVELDPKVFELAQARMGFRPTERTPVMLMDGRMFVKRDRTQWDWIILDAFRGGFVPPHLKTEEFYRECAARLRDRGVFTTNLHPSSRLYAADLKTLQRVFPQIMLFRTRGRGNVIACAVKYAAPTLAEQLRRAPVEQLTTQLGGRADFAQLRDSVIGLPGDVAKAPVLTDDFAPVEFLDALKSNNTGE